MLLVIGLLAPNAGAIELNALEAAGKRLYQTGIAASGSTLSARVGAQESAVPGNTVPCVNCHGADGKGRHEGEVRPPEISWRELSKPYGHRHDSGRQHGAFDAAAFYRAVTEGRDPAGNRLNPAMPRYAMAHSDAAALLAYLQKIDHDHDPGVDDGVLRIGTVLPQSGPLAESARLVEKVVQGVFAQTNAGGGLHGRRLELVVVDAVDAPGGPALPERLAAADVFALVGPLAPGAGKELFTLAEKTGLPVVGPLAGDSDGRRQVFQLAPGDREQGRALAEFAVRQLQLDDPSVVLMVPPQENELASAVEAQLARHGWQRISRQVPWPAMGLGLAVAAWQKQGVQVVFYFGAADDFAALRRAADSAGWSPVFLAPAAHAGSAGLSGTGVVYLALPALPGDGTPAGRQALEALRQQHQLPARQPALQAAAYAAANVLVEGLNRVGRAASRERLVDMLENLYAFDTGVTPPVGFGPGRRVGIMGAHVVAADPVTRRVHAVGGFVQVE
ncbi:MAG TPA: ABC transporter substrate-binding protein [Rhodocyclaceae bacterium]|nr:ABC transporter substrate-binding protein [Rhodocyclaceae bacterium]